MLTILAIGNCFALTFACGWLWRDTSGGLDG